MGLPIRTVSRLLLSTLAALTMVPSQAAQLVRMGAAHFPPYTVRPESGADTGLLPQLIQALNASQTDYQFVLVPTSVPRRFGDFLQGGQTGSRNYRMPAKSGNVAQLGVVA